MANKLSLPFEATEALKVFGKNLKTARLRRNMTLEDVSSRVGVHRETLALAESGNPTVSIGTFVGALWVLGLLSDLSHTADPEADRLGKSLERMTSRERARRPGQGLSNDF